MKTHILTDVELAPGEPGTIRTTITPQADAVKPLAPSLPNEAQDFVDLTAELLNSRNELESRRIDSAQLERFVERITAAMPGLRSLMGSPSDHAEYALAKLVRERDALRAALEELLDCSVPTGQDTRTDRAMKIANEILTPDRYS